MTITPEELKAVAECMGYESEIRGTANIVYIRPEQQIKGEPALPYNPLTNPKQDRELELKFNISTMCAMDGSKYIAHLYDDKGNYYNSGESKTPTEARLKAVLKMNKE